MLVRDGSTRCDAHKVRLGSFADRTRGSRHQRGYGTQWDKTRERVMRRDVVCQPCKRHGVIHAAHHVDHIVPKALGGTDADSNLQGICRAAHAAKTAAEAQGRAWDEAAWVAGQAGGGSISTPSAARTDRLAKFSRAGVSEGGVPCSEVLP